MKKLKFNILDAVIIVFVIALACLFAFKFVAPSKIQHNAEFHDVQYVLKIESIRDISVDALHENTGVYYEEDKTFMGTVVKKEVENAKTIMVLSDGKSVLTEVPERYDVYLTVSANGIQKNNGFYLNGKTPINVGNDRMYRVGHVVFTAKIIEIYS